jgi:beta-glucanase (GH16 family)
VTRRSRATFLAAVLAVALGSLPALVLSRGSGANSVDRLEPLASGAATRVRSLGVERVQIEDCSLVGVVASSSVNPAGLEGFAVFGSGAEGAGAATCLVTALTAGEVVMSVRYRTSGGVTRMISVNGVALSGGVRYLASPDLWSTVAVVLPLRVGENTVRFDLADVWFDWIELPGGHGAAQSPTTTATPPTTLSPTTAEPPTSLAPTTAETATTAAVEGDDLTWSTGVAEFIAIPAPSAPLTTVASASASTTSTASISATTTTLGSRTSTSASFGTASATTSTLALKLLVATTIAIPTTATSTTKLTPTAASTTFAPTGGTTTVAPTTVAQTTRAATTVPPSTTTAIVTTSTTTVALATTTTTTTVAPAPATTTTLVPSSTTTSRPAPARSLTWSDEFTSGLGADWTAVTTGGGDFDDTFGLECYRAEQSVVVGGALQLTAQPKPATCNGSSRSWVSGLVTTRRKFSQTYGRFEARMKLPLVKGTWPAFWLMPADAAYGGWPNSGEIDIMEYVAKPLQTVFQTVHWGESGAHKASSAGADLASPASEWHRYAIEWEPAIIRWYVDDVLVHSYRVPGGTAPFDKPFYVIINQAVGGEWPGPPTSSDYPATVLVDWVRVFAPL